jgi:uncharacterized protein YbcI
MKRKRKNVNTAIASGIIFLALTIFPGYTGQDLLEGKVNYLDKSGKSLEQKISSAVNEFKKDYIDGGFLEQKISSAVNEFKKDYIDGGFFIGYIFQSRHQIHMGNKLDSPTSFGITTRDGEIKISRSYKGKEKSGYSIHTEDEKNSPAGIILLYKLSGKKAEMCDAALIDLERSYEFKKEPLFWLGKAENRESLKLLKDSFESGIEDLQDSLLFVISSHNGIEAGKFLRSAALGRYPTEIRKNAIFWIGNLKDDKSIDYLKEIYKKSKEKELREQVIFALHLCDNDDAVKEMIRIARQDSSSEIRKNAIFWLGQRACQESIIYLKGVVEETDEDDEVKNSAVFAISQLPKEKSIPLLIDIAKNNKSASVRKKAIFWLGQTGDEEAIKFFEKILLKK